jgi:hypothetical protein
MSLNFCFYLWVCERDYKLPLKLIQEILSLYPTKQIIIISDGKFADDNYYSAYPQIIFSVQEHQKNLKNGESFLTSKYSKLLELSPAELFIKLDPDSIIRKRLTFPNSDWFGQIFNHLGIAGTWGCGMGINRKIVQKLIKSNLDNTDFYYTSASDDRLLSEDITLAYHLNKLGIYPTKWSEVNLQQSAHAGLFFSNHSIIHPSYGKKIKQHYPEFIKCDNHIKRLVSATFHNRVNFCDSFPIGSPINNNLRIKDNLCYIEDHCIGDLTQSDLLEIWFSNKTATLRENLEGVYTASSKIQLT